MTVEEIKASLAKPATKFIAGGFRPNGHNNESWLGKVFLYKDDEEIPLDEKGEKMLPLAQIYLPSLPYCHSLLQNTKMLTLFVSPSLPGQLEEMGKNFIIREYHDLESLVIKEFDFEYSFLKSFPLKNEFIKADYPQWDSYDTYDMQNAIIELEESGEIESYFDITEHEYTHKIGGYPSFCQPGIDFGENYEFVFQISSDAKINLNVVDSGSLMFAKNVESGKWIVYYDFY